MSAAMKEELKTERIPMACAMKELEMETEDPFAMHDAWSPRSDPCLNSDESHLILCLSLGWLCCKSRCLGHFGLATVQRMVTGEVSCFSRIHYWA